jgi:hypothetical protein
MTILADLCLALSGPVLAQERERYRTRLRPVAGRVAHDPRRIDGGHAPHAGGGAPFFEEEMLPFLESLGSLIDDLSAYEMPERLPNGDIIIRRSPDRPWPDPDEPVVGEGGRRGA